MMLLERKKSLAQCRYKPLLFVITPSIMGAKKAVEMMRDDFKLNPLLVVGELEDSGLSSIEKRELRSAAANLGDPNSPYDSVVSVYMLREGWDVPEVSVMCLLRGFGSPLFAHQVLGRGLRLIRRNNLIEDRSIQELTVIDHPCLGLDDLWTEIDALVQEGDEIVREREISREGDQNIDTEEKQKYPEQVIVRQDLYKLLQVPGPKTIRDITAERALEILEESLEALRTHRPELLILTGVEVDGIDTIAPKQKKRTSRKILLKLPLFLKIMSKAEKLPKANLIKCLWNGPMTMQKTIPPCQYTRVKFTVQF